MLPKKHRLSKSVEVKQTTARGRSFFNPNFVVKVLPNKIEGVIKFTVIVSAKVSKKAVVRNKLKRMFREQFRINLSKIRSGYYAVIVKPKSTQVESNVLRQEFINTLVRSKILQNG